MLCRPVDFKKVPCRLVDLEKVPCRMSLRPKKGRVAMSILGVFTHCSSKGFLIGILIIIILYYFGLFENVNYINSNIDLWYILMIIRFQWQANAF